MLTFVHVHFHVLSTDIGFAILAEALEREVLQIRLNLGIVELVTNKTFGIKDAGIKLLDKKIKRQIDVHVNRVYGDLVLCGIANQTFIFREGYIGRGC